MIYFYNFASMRKQAAPQHKKMNSMETTRQNKNSPSPAEGTG